MADTVSVTASISAVIGITSPYLREAVVRVEWTDPDRETVWLAVHYF